MSGKIIDLEQKRNERLNFAQTEEEARLAHMKLRLDLERAKLAIPASILSIVVVVSVMNTRLLSESELFPSKGSSSLASSTDESESRTGETELFGRMNQRSMSRSVASVPTGTTVREDQLVQRLNSELGSGTLQAIGRKPSDIERLALETLGGNYKVAVNPKNQHLVSIELLKDASAVQFEQSFFNSYSSVFPSGYKKAIRIQHSERPEKQGFVETYQLVNNLSRPLAEVQIETDHEGRLLRLKVQ